MQGKGNLNGFNPDLLKEPIETFPKGQVNKWESRAALFNRKRVEMGLGDIQRQTFDCTSDEDIGSSVPSEVIENSSLHSSSAKTKKSRRPSNALNELIIQEKRNNNNQMVDNYKSKINHVLNLINSHSSVNQQEHHDFMLPNFALIFLIIICLFSFCLRNLSHGIQLINFKLFNFICCKKNLPLTCLALIFYIFLMILSAIISFLLNPIPKKISELFIKF